MFEVNNNNNLKKVADILSVDLSIPQYKVNVCQTDRTKKSQYDIYPIKHINKLFMDRQNKTVRYFVDSNMQLWVAPEGVPSEKTPAHFQMSGVSKSQATCVAAGNLIFSEDFQRLVKVSNKSGDFQPNFECLQWILAILATNESNLPFALSDTLILEKAVFEPGGGKKYKINTVDLRQWVKDAFNEQIELISLFKNQPCDIRIADYSISPNNFSSLTRRCEENQRTRNFSSQRLDFGHEDPAADNCFLSHQASSVDIFFPTTKAATQELPKKYSVARRLNFSRLDDDASLSMLFFSPSDAKKRTNLGESSIVDNHFQIKEQSAKNIFDNDTNNYEQSKKNHAVKRLHSLRSDNDASSSTLFFPQCDTTKRRKSGERLTVDDSLFLLQTKNLSTNSAFDNNTNDSVTESKFGVFTK